MGEGHNSKQKVLLDNWQSAIDNKLYARQSTRKQPSSYCPNSLTRMQMHWGALKTGILRHEQQIELLTIRFKWEKGDELMIQANDRNHVDEDCKLSQTRNVTLQSTN